MLKYFTFLILIVATNACNHRGGSDEAVDDTIQKVTGADSAVAQHQEPAGVIDYSLTGFYQGHLPCEGCDGSQQTLLLKDDGRFMLQDLPRQQDELHTTHEGFWSVSKGSIVLFSNNVVIGRFQPRRDSLLTVQRQGTILSDSASIKYSLVRKPNAAQHLPYKKQLASGNGLIALGTEPFWSLRLDSSADFHFRLAEWKKERLFNNAVSYKSGDSILFQVVSSDSIKVAISRDFCSDGMSDFLFEYRVRIYYHNKVYTGCGLFSSDPFREKPISESSADSSVIAK